MKILVVGSGGREHALCWHIAQSPLVDQLYCAPGNPGTARRARNVPLAAEDLDGLLAFARAERVDLTVCGPEAPLCAGIADRFAAAGLCLAGPRAAAAQLEGSKAFAKEFMARHGIPTAPFAVFEDADAAASHIAAHPAARVVKADGLAAGKGVHVCADAAEAQAAARRILAGELGAAGRRVVIESRLVGEEASFIALSDGERLWPLAGSQDHKAVLDGDRGPNTGGMGAYSPAPVLTAELQQRVVEQVMLPTIHGLAAEGTPYRGILYAGLMIRADGGFDVLEFNCRFGDPETQPLMMRLASDLVPYLVGLAAGRLPAEPPRWDPRTALCVVLAARGYPGACDIGHEITGIAEAEQLEDVTVFQASTRGEAGRLLTAGGRVLGITALGVDAAQARERAYRAVERIRWEGMHFRRDIAHRALARHQFGGPQRIHSAGGERPCRPLPIAGERAAGAASVNAMMTAAVPPIVPADAAGVARAVALLQQGEVVAFPTETVYGLAAAALDAAAVERLCALKGRDPLRAVPLLVADRAMLEQVVSRIPARAEALIVRHWPGPLTLVLPGRAELPAPIRGVSGGVGVRISADPAAAALVRAFGAPLTATSANLAGATAATSAASAALPGVALVLDDGPRGSPPSTVVELLDDDAPRILRQGALTLSPDELRA